MSKKLKFDLVSPERLLVSSEVDGVQVPGQEGDFGVLPDHSAVISVIRPGILSVNTGSDKQDYYVRGGFADVNENGLTVLAEFAVELSAFSADAKAAEIEMAQSQLAETDDDQIRLSAQTVLDVVAAL
jgi:F-type H+-transporting ATPase subunit epsilon